MISQDYLKELQDEAILKSALYSARIEGNDMTLEEARNIFLNKNASSLLIPKRAKILEIIKKHKITNLARIKRTLPKINDRTLRYDLKKLQEQKLIRKLGITRGVYYTAWENSF